MLACSVVAQPPASTPPLAVLPLLPLLLLSSSSAAEDDEDDDGSPGGSSPMDLGSVAVVVVLLVVVVVVVVPSIEGRVLRRPRTLFIIESFFAIFVCLRDGCALLSLYGVDMTFEASLVGGAAGLVVFAHHRLGLCCSFCDSRGGCNATATQWSIFLARPMRCNPPPTSLVLLWSYNNKSRIDYDSHENLQQKARRIKFKIVLLFCKLKSFLATATLWCITHTHAKKDFILQNSTILNLILLLLKVPVACIVHPAI